MKHLIYKPITINAADLQPGDRTVGPGACVVLGSPEPHPDGGVCATVKPLDGDQSYVRVWPDDTPIKVQRRTAIDISPT